MAQDQDKKSSPVLAQNRRAGHDYHIEETIEAGIVLQGTEVKVCRSRDVSMADAYADIRDGELWLIGVHIAPYSHGNRRNHEPRRERKLLLHQAEIRRLAKAVELKGMTLIPLRLVLKKGMIKVDIGLCRGKNLYDKRDSLKSKEQAKEMRRAVARI